MTGPAARSPGICLGAIAGAHGVRGLVKVKCFTAVPENIAAYGPLADEGGTRRFRLRVVRKVKDGVLAAIEGIADRNAAEALRGTRLYIERAALPAPADDEFYQVDLIGLRAERSDGGMFGSVVALHDFGAGDLLEIRPADGGATVMLPFTREVVPLVDLAGGRIVVVPPAETVAAPEPEEGV